MSRTVLRTAFWMLAAALAGLALGADRAENPVYKSWAGFKKGSTVTYRSVSKIAGTEYVSMMTYSLVDLTQDKAVVEMQVTTVSNGQEVKNRPQKFDNPRSLTLPPGIKPEQFGKIQGLIAEGEETLSAAGRDWKAKWFKAKGKIEAGDTFTQSWSCDQVPGNLVKSVVTTPGNQSSMTMELVDVKIP